MSKEGIIESVENILGELNKVQEKLVGILDDYRMSGRTNILGDDLESLEIVDLTKIGESIDDLVYQIQEAELIYKD